MGKYKDSERIFNELIDRNPYSTTYWNALASTQLMNEDYNNAITSSEYAIAIAPNDPEGIATLSLLSELPPRVISQPRALARCSP